MSQIQKPLLAYTDADNVQQIVTASNVQRVKFNKNCVFETQDGEVFIDALKTEVDTINNKTNKMKKGNVEDNGDATEIEDNALFNERIFYKQSPGDINSTNIDLINQIEIQENYIATLQDFQNSTKYSESFDTANIQYLYQNPGTIYDTDTQNNTEIANTNYNSQKQDIYSDNPNLSPNGQYELKFQSSNGNIVLRDTTIPTTDDPNANVVWTSGTNDNENENAEYEFTTEGIIVITSDGGTETVGDSSLNGNLLALDNNGNVVILKEITDAIISVSDTSSSIFNKATKTVQFTAMDNTLALYYTGIIYMNGDNVNVVSLNDSGNNWTNVSVDMTGDQWALNLDFTNDTSSSMNVSFLQISS